MLFLIIYTDKLGEFLLKYIKVFILIFITIYLPTYSQNVVNLGLSTQELKNGISLFNDRQYSAAIQAFELALSYEPSNYAAKYRLGLAFLYAGYTESAAKTWKELVDLGVADHQLIEQLNSLTFNLAKDIDYHYTDPYVFRKYYDGLTESAHDILRSSFIIYDQLEDKKYISSTAVGTVVEMNSANKILNRYGKKFLVENILKMPTGIALYSNQLYVADYKKNQIFVFDRNLSGSLARSFGQTGYLSNQMLGPMGIVFSEDEYLYIVDNGNHRILKYLPDGTYVSAFGKNFLYRPTDIVAYQEYIFVTDISQNNIGRVAQFDRQGNFIQYIGTEFLKEPRGLFLDNDQLYISDVQNSLYIYNITQNVSYSLIANEEKLAYPFDIIKDKDSILWRTDFNSQKIAIYTPLQGIYGNIVMNVTQILTDQYPYIYALVRARNKDGSPLVGINSGELKISEFDMPVSGISVTGTEKARSNLLTHMLIDRSMLSEKFMPQLEYYVKTFLSNNSGQDLIEVSLIDDKVYRSARMPASVSKIWSFITNHKPIAPMPGEWDQPIYDSITSLLNNLRNRSVVIFTSGEGSNKAFTTYGSDVIKSYADMNSIPIYVINFSSQNIEFWQKIARLSHGKYYNSMKDAREILKLYNTIKTSTPLEYLVEYDAYNYSDVPGLWVDLTIQLNRFGVNGAVISGYYVPTPMPFKKNIDIQKEMM